VTYPTKNVGFHRGKPRIYFQSPTLHEIGFGPGARYNAHADDFSVTLAANPEGKRAVCKKQVGGKVFSIIDLNAGLDIFKDVKVVEVLYQPGRIYMRAKIEEQP